MDAALHAPRIGPCENEAIPDAPRLLSPVLSLLSGWSEGAGSGLSCAFLACCCEQGGWTGGVVGVQSERLCCSVSGVGVVYVCWIRREALQDGDGERASEQTGEA